MKNREQYEQSRKKALPAGARVNPTHKAMVSDSLVGDWGDLGYVDGVAVTDSRGVKFLKKTGQIPNVPNPLIGTRR